MDPFGRPDPNGAEALPGESTREYIARQEKLKTEARARMRAKFGGGGLGGVGSDGSYRGGTTMQGVGSNSDYDPSTGKYRGQKTGIQSLREGEFTSDNVKDAALEAASKLKKFGAKLAEEDTVRDLSKTAKSTAAGLMRAAQGGEFFEPAEEWRKLVHRMIHKDDLPSPSITDLRSLTRYMGDRRKAADIFDDIRKALKPTPAYRALQRALACVRHLVVNGPEHVVDRAWHLRREIQDLEGYDSTRGYLGTRNDEGRFVREKAKELATLLDDFDQIRELRADAARNTYEGDRKPAYNEGASGRYDSYSGGGGFERSRRNSYDPDLRDSSPVPKEPEPAAPVADLLDLNLGGGDDDFGAFETAGASTTSATTDDGFAAFQGAPAADDGFASFQSAPTPALSAPPGDAFAAPPAPAANDEWAAFAAAPAQQPPPPPQPGFASFGAAPSQAMPGASPAERFMADGQLFSSMGATPNNGPGLIPPPANGFPSYLPSPSALNANAAPPPRQRWSSNAATEKDAFSDLLGGELSGGK